MWNCEAKIPCLKKQGVGKKPEDGENEKREDKEKENCK